MKNTDYEKCLVLDSSYMPRSVIWTNRAFVINMKGNAEVLAEHPETFKLVNKDLKIKKPSVIKVNKYVSQPFIRVPLNRHNLYKRDGYQCVYCGCTNKKELTIDHIIPKSKGGTDTWENLVTACKPCNHQKSDLTLEELGIPHPKVKRPHYLMMLTAVDKIPNEWKKYLLL